MRRIHRTLLNDFQLQSFVHIQSQQKDMTLKHVTCSSFPWNKAKDFRTPMFCPNMDKNKIDATRTELARATSHPNK